MYIVNLILDIPLNTHYSYLTELFLEQGTRVTVNFRGRSQIALVKNCLTHDEFIKTNNFSIDKLKPILNISTEQYRIPPDIWQLCQFASDYYHYPIGQTLFCAIPPLLRKVGELDIDLQETQYYKLLTMPDKLRSQKHQECLTKLAENLLSQEQIHKILGTTYKKIITSWLSNNVIELVTPDPNTVINQFELNEEQQQVVSAVAEQFGSYYPALLYGITGSGKTEVFLQLIHQALIKNLQVLVLVPEISLSPQLLARFSQRFIYAKICIINSAVSEKNRALNWLNAKTGAAQIIISTRLGVFTPCHNLGLIIVDEEHDESFKQNESLRYHARDLAIWRAHQLNIPIVLASATPSLETIHNYSIGKYQLYKLTKRANLNAALPTIKLVNLNQSPVNYAGISQPALSALEERLKRNELVMIFINRRGYAPIISCYDCGWVSSCPNCTSRMVYHHPDSKVKCHHCGYSTRVPKKCPKCSNQYLHTIGHGTQKLEQFLQEHFPSNKIRRVDRDTMSKKHAWHEIYQQIADNQYDILVGTQMLAKGHDFANLTLVIGLNLDSALFSYDFRASEDMFNGLLQVAGRAGRADKSGMVILQTHFSDNPVYQFLVTHNFNGFINYTLKERKNNQLPPYTHYALVKLSSIYDEKLDAAMHELRIISRSITEIDNLTIYPPVPAVINKLNNKFRGQMLISATNRSSLHRYLEKLAPKIHALKVDSAIDVDPFEL